MDQVSSQGVVGSDAQNHADPKGVHTRSTFDEKALGYNFFATLPFGEIRPFTFMESVPDDKRIRAQFLSQVYSYTLKAPLMQGIHMKKLLCQVPREAILPLNWEKWFKNPVIGQDVPGDAGTSVLGFWHSASQVCWTLKGDLPSTKPTDIPTASLYLQDWFKYLIICEMFYSDGNLLKHCNISGSPWCFSFKSDGITHNSIDYVFDKFIYYLLSQQNLPQGGIFDLTFGSGLNAPSYRVVPEIDPNKSYPIPCLNIREALSMMRDDLNFSISIPFGTSISFVTSLFDSVTQDVEMDLEFVDDVDTEEDRVPVDLKRLWAYQMVCAHFLTNDSVDFVYTAELYRQYVFYLVNNLIGVDFFTVNGMDYQYDFLSAHYASLVLNHVKGNGFDSDESAFGYLCALFSFKRSLRYLDYFTGAKTRPLAVGDVTVEVNNNRVNVVDTQAKTFLARFLNVINRVGLRNYVEGVFNVRQAPDWHNPQYLIKLDDIVTGERVENTASEQWEKPNSVTSLLHGNSDRFAFEMDFDRSSVIIGVVWFDVDRVYSMATERQNLHYDRFDEFQPFMQYTGDQPLYRVELGSPLHSNGNLQPMDAFGYKLRNAEYKERFDQCAGGFCTDMLDGYLFKADVLESSAIQNVGPSFIRSFPSELDRFYLSLSGYSLATYFHFIVRFNNLYSGSRPMAYAPTLM